LDASVRSDVQRKRTEEFAARSFGGRERNGQTFDSSCAGEPPEPRGLTGASIEKMIQLDVMDCRVKPGNDDVEGQRLVTMV
jgi:hypothetical protein